MDLAYSHVTQARMTGRERVSRGIKISYHMDRNCDISSYTINYFIYIN